MADREFTSASFNKYLKEKRLMAARCQGCGRINLPPRPMCGWCHGFQMDWAELSGIGALAAFTAISIGPSAMVESGYGRDNPYVSGIVTLEEGPSISARILGVDAKAPETIRVGTPVHVEFLDQGEGEAARAVLAFRAKGA